MPKANETKVEEQQRVDQEKNQLGDHLLASLDLPSEEELTEDTEGGDIERKPKGTEDAEEEETQEEESEEKGEETEPEETEESEKQTEEDEELIPKSTFLKRIEREKMARAKAEAELEEMKETKSAAKDPRRSKLEALSEKELRALKRQTRKEFKTTEDTDREEQLLDLEDEIDEIIRTAPERFQKAQMTEYNKAAKQAMSIEDIDFEKHGQQIQKIAIGIYQKEKDLQKIKRGQAIALELAVDHFKEISKYSKGKSKETSLKQQVTKLKRKTSLDSGSVQGDANKPSRRKLYAKAKASPYYDDKQAVIDDLLGEEVSGLLKE